MSTSTEGSRERAGLRHVSERARIHKGPGRDTTPGGARLRHASRRAAGALTTAAVIVGLGVIAPGAAQAAASDHAEALGEVITMTAAGPEVLDASSSTSGYPSDPGPHAKPLDPELFGALRVDLGDGLVLPLVSGPDGKGLLEAGELGALSSYASSPDAMTAAASAGVVGRDGAIGLDLEKPAAHGSATLNLTDLLTQLALDGVTDEVVDEASIDLGAFASTVRADEDRVTGDYVVSGAELNLSSPLVATVPRGVDRVLDGIGYTVNAALGSRGALASVLRTLSFDLDLGLARLAVNGGTIEVAGLGAALDQLGDRLAAEPLSDPDGIATVDLDSGHISVDLAKVAKGPGAEDLNGLAPDTPLLGRDTIAAITTAVADALGTLPAKAAAGVKEVLDATAITIDLDAELRVGFLTSDVDVVVDTTLGHLAGTDTSVEPRIDVEGNLLGIPVGRLIGALAEPLLGELVETLRPVTSVLLDGLVSGVSTAVQRVVDPVVGGVDPVLAAIDDVVAITVNERSAPGRLGAGSLSITALSMQLLPGADGVDLDLASSTARATAFTPELAVDDPVAPGARTSVSGAGWPPDAEVTLRLEEADGSRAGEEITTRTDGDGRFPADTSYRIPSDAGVRSYALAASDELGSSARAVVAVAYSPELSASGPLRPGESAAIAGEGWPAGADVRLQLLDPSGSATGDPVTVTSGTDGSLPADTAIPVDPAAPGGRYTVTASAANGAEATASFVVESATGPSLLAEDPAAPGSDLPVSGTGWPPGADVTLQLRDPAGAPVGDPVTIATGGDGSFPSDARFPVPSGLDDGDYLLEARDAKGRSAADGVSVRGVRHPAYEIRTEQAFPGDNLFLTSAGWPPNTEVTLVLRDAAGAAKGPEATVVTGADGAFPATAHYIVPAGLETGGEYTLAASDGVGSAATGTVRISVPTLQALGPVAAGDELPVTSSGWPPNTRIYVAVGAAGTGEQAGESISIDSDGSGAWPAGFAFPIPEGTVPGDYIMMATTPRSEYTVSDAVTVFDPASR